MSDVLDDQINRRFTVLTWAVGITAGLMVATFGMVVTMSYQLGIIANSLNILIGRIA